MTVAEILTQKKQRLQLYLAAEAAILSGAQSYSIGHRQITRADLRSVQAEVEKLTVDVAQLSRGGNAIRVQRIVPRDS
jgi:hypothetical protein